MKRKGDGLAQLQKEKQEAERKRVEAQGIADYQRIEYNSPYLF
jgi:hypothetical protein